ncbi:MAG: TIGR04255 family protein [Thermoleophilia bacterium]|nr:TIGR04255 family protein [Thermoleophilia bacterium]
MTLVDAGLAGRANEGARGVLADGQSERYSKSAMPHYTKAPITEAIIDIRAVLPEGIDLGDIDRLGREMLPDYPERQDRFLFEATVRGGAEVGAQAKQTRIGFLYRSFTDPSVVQYRLDGFTVSRLTPYADWHSFREEARRLWGFYESALRPQLVTRLAVRYINRLDVPAFHFELAEYLGAFPQLPDGIPHPISGFVMQLEIPQADIGATLLLNIATAESRSPEVTSILLDIDVFREMEIRGDFGGLWENLNQLRERKNTIFEACITDKTRRLIA